MLEISKLYNEIVLTKEFQTRYNKLEYFEKNNKYCTVFSDSLTNTKVIIIDILNQNICYQNLKNTLTGNTELYILNSDLKNDKILYSLNKLNGELVEFLNPINTHYKEIKILNRIQLNFKLKNISIKEVLLKDDLVFFLIEGELIKKNIENRMIFFVFDKKTHEIYEISNLDLVKKDYYFNLKNTLNRSIITFDFNDSFLMEPIMGVFNVKNRKYKHLHPSHLCKFSNNFVLILPEYGYNLFSDFLLINLNNFSEIDLYNIIIPLIHKDEINDLSVGMLNDMINITIDDKLIFRDYEFSCAKLFSEYENNSNELFETINHGSLINIENENFKGYALDIHTIKSVIKPDGTFDTIRTELGELLFNLKYKFDKKGIDIIAEKCIELINKLNIDIIIPVPPSNLNRPFQPVYELSKKISNLTNIPTDLDYVSKKSNQEIKTFSKSEDRIEILRDSIILKDKRFKGKNILLFDDLYRSGDTLKVISEKLINEGEVKTVEVLCVTKTRIKR